MESIEPSNSDYSSYYNGVYQRSMVPNDRYFVENPPQYNHIIPSRYENPPERSAPSHSTMLNNYLIPNNVNNYHHGSHQNFTHESLSQNSMRLMSTTPPPYQSNEEQEHQRQRQLRQKMLMEQEQIMQRAIRIQSAQARAPPQMPVQQPPSRSPFLDQMNQMNHTNIPHSYSHSKVPQSIQSIQQIPYSHPSLYHSHSTPSIPQQIEPDYNNPSHPQNLTSNTVYQDHQRHRYYEEFSRSVSPHPQQRPQYNEYVRTVSPTPQQANNNLHNIHMQSNNMNAIHPHPPSSPPLPTQQKQMTQMHQPPSQKQMLAQNIPSHATASQLESESQFDYSEDPFDSPNQVRRAISGGEQEDNSENDQITSHSPYQSDKDEDTYNNERNGFSNPFEEKPITPKIDSEGRQLTFEELLERELQKGGKPPQAPSNSNANNNNSNYSNNNNSNNNNSTQLAKVPINFLKKGARIQKPVDAKKPAKQNVNSNNVNTNTTQSNGNGIVVSSKKPVLPTKKNNEDKHEVKEKNRVEFKDEGDSDDEEHEEREIEEEDNGEDNENLDHEEGDDSSDDQITKPSRNANVDWELRKSKEEEELEEFTQLELKISGGEHLGEEDDDLVENGEDALLQNLGIKETDDGFDDFVSMGKQPNKALASDSDNDEKENDSEPERGEDDDDFGDTHTWGNLDDSFSSKTSARSPLPQKKPPQKTSATTHSNANSNVLKKQGQAPPTSNLVNQIWGQKENKHSSTKNQVKGKVNNNNNNHSNQNSNQNNNNSNANNVQNHTDVFPPVAQAVVDELTKKCKLLEAELASIQILNAKLQEQDKRSKRESAEWEVKKQEELAKIQEEKQKIRKEEIRKSRLPALDRKEREELDNLKVQLNQAHEEIKNQKSKMQLTIDRYKKQVEELTLKNKELEDELRYREQQRIDKWELEEKKNETLANNDTNTTKKVNSFEHLDTFSEKPNTEEEIINTTHTTTSSKPPAIHSHPHSQNPIQSKTQTNSIPLQTQQPLSTKISNLSTPLVSQSQLATSTKSTLPSTQNHQAVTTKSSNTLASLRSKSQTQPPLVFNSIPKVSNIRFTKPSMTPVGFKSQQPQNVNNDTEEKTQKGSSKSSIQEVVDYPDSEEEQASDVEDQTNDEKDANENGNQDDEGTENIELPKSISPPSGLKSNTPISETVISEQHFSDGKIERIYLDGRRSTQFSNGTKKETRPDGSSVVYFINGDIKTTLANQCVEYYYAETEATHVTYPSGLEIFKFTNGQIEKHYSDGTKEITFSDGTVKKTMPNGEEENIFPNGTVQRVNKDGIKVVLFTNGTKEIERNDGVKEKIYPDGITKLYFADGRTEMKYPPNFKGKKG